MSDHALILPYRTNPCGYDFRERQVSNIAEPFAAVIFCTADPEKVDYRMRSKWSRVLRYAADYKDLDEPLRDFIKRKGGINKCATRYTSRLGRHRGQIL